MDKEKIEELLKVDLLKELGLEDLTRDEALGLADEMSKTVMQGVLLRIAERLNPEKQEEFAEVLEDAKGPEDVIAFLKKEIPDFEDIVKGEVAFYKSVLLAK